jgi:hypothetical protein
MLVKHEAGVVDLRLLKTLYDVSVKQPEFSDLLIDSKFRQDISGKESFEIFGITDEPDRNFALFVLGQIAELSNTKKITLSEKDMLAIGGDIQSILSESSCEASIVTTSYDEYHYSAVMPREDYPGSSIIRDYIFPWVYAVCIFTYVMSKMPPELFSGIYNMGQGAEVDLTGETGANDGFGD